MTITDNLALGGPLLLQGATVATGDLTIDTISNISIVAVAWYFYKRTETKNEKMESKLEDKENKHKQEMAQQQERFLSLLKEQEEKAEAREQGLFSKLIDSLQNRD